MTDEVNEEACTCPPGGKLIHVGCPVHFGDGFGLCVPCYEATEKVVAAVAVVDGTCVCKSCLVRPR